MIKPGQKYFHYKNKDKFYRIVAVGKYKSNLEDVVVYETLYQNPLSNIWVRTVEDFSSLVDIDGKKFPRFTLVEE